MGRVVGYIIRFIKILTKKDNASFNLTFTNLCEAKHILLMKVQQNEFQEDYHILSEGKSVPKSSPIFKLNPILDQDGLIRVQGRLERSFLNSDEQSPILLHKGYMGLLIARHLHVLNKHAGVNHMLLLMRNQFWVLGARQICKRVMKECIYCYRQKT